jgi:hypothetical protein
VAPIGKVAGRLKEGQDANDGSVAASGGHETVSSYGVMILIPKTPWMIERGRH